MVKQEYFSPESIEEKSIKMIERINNLGLPNKVLNFNPQKAALLVLDVQKYFFSTESHAFIPSAPSIIPNIQKLIEYFYINKLPIFYSKHSNKLGSAGMMEVWWRDLIILESEMSEFIKEIDIKKGIIIKKERYDAFWKTTLGGLLKDAGVEQVVICGVMTHLCCETTARSAFVQDFKVFFTIDGTATYSEELHLASLLTLSHGFANTILCKEILGRSV